MKWHLPGLHLGQLATSGVVVAGLLGAAGGNAVGAEQELPAGRPALGKNADGYLEVFKVEAEGEVLHRWQKRASGDWSSWASLGGAVLPGIAVVTNADGRMEVSGVERASQTLGQVRQAGPNS